MPTSEDASRSVSEYLAIFRRRFWLIALVFLVSVGMATAYTLHQPTLYRSSMRIVIGQEGGTFQLNVGNVADTFTQTMSDLIQTDVVARGTIRKLGLDITPNDLLDHLNVTTKPETSVMSVSYDDNDRARGVRVLSTLGDVFTSLVAQRLASPNRGNSNLAVTATVFDFAHSIPGQVQPKPTRTVAVAVVLGLFLGLLAALGREQFDDTIRSVEDAERAFGQTATATLPPGIVGYRPFDPSSAKRQDPVLTELAIQRLRASIRWSAETREARTVLVTSPNPEEGKTTISANLALVMATEGYNVILVEADLRHPTLHRYLGMPARTQGAGLEEIMGGEMSPSEALVEIPVPAKLFATFRAEGDAPAPRYRAHGESRASGRLRAIMAHSHSTQPTEFSLAATARLIDDLRSRADYVIIDSPPILVVPDAYPFAVTADMVLAVVRCGRSAGKAVAALSKSLERLRVRRVELVVTEADAGFNQPYYYGDRVRAGRQTSATTVRGVTSRSRSGGNGDGHGRSSLPSTSPTQRRSR